MVGSPIVVIDIGASKIQCLIGEGLPDGENVRILGAGNSLCQGIRRNSIIDMPRVVQAIRDAVAEAERSAGLNITGAFVGVGGGEGIEIQTSKSAVAVSGLSEPIDERDVQRAVAAAEQASPPCDGLVLHRFIQSYAVDDEPVHNPLWLHGNRLEVETLSAAASGNLCTTLERAVSEAGLAIASYEWIAAVTLVIMGLWLLPLFLKLGIFTMPEFLEHRYGPPARTLMAVYMMIAYVGVAIASVLYSGAIGLKTIFGLELGKGIFKPHQYKCV